MEKNNKTDNFLKAINKYSKLERQQIQNDIETVRAEELKKAEANGKKMAKDFITKEYSAVKTAVTGQYAVKNLEAQGKVYKKREEITTSVFEKAFAKLKDFTSTPQYKDLLIKSAKEIADIFKENSCVIFISENDNKFAQDIKAQFSGEVTVENDVAIKIGGTKGFCKDLKIVADNTLDSKLNSQKDWFTENSGLKVM